MCMNMNDFNKFLNFNFLSVFLIQIMIMFQLMSFSFVLKNVHFLILL